MIDIVDTATRRRMMAGIKSSNTRPELFMRKGLHARGLRYRLGGSGLPGRPDLVLPKYKVALFVHGCFWHSHGCSAFKLPTTNVDFWRTKLGANIKRDSANVVDLLARGWRVAIVWECDLKVAMRGGSGDLHDTVRDWVMNYDESYKEFTGEQQQ